MQTNKPLVKTNAELRQNVFARYYQDGKPLMRPFSATIRKSLPEIFNLLSNVENFSLFFENLEKVQITDKKTGAQQAKFNFRSSENENLVFEMSSEVIDDYGLIWKAIDGAGFEYSIVIELEEAVGRGTVVRLMVNYDNITGKLAGTFEKIFGKDADIVSKKNIQRLQAFCETGHVPTIEGQPNGNNEIQPQIIKH